MNAVLLPSGRSSAPVSTTAGGAPAATWPGWVAALLLLLLLGTRTAQAQPAVTLQPADLSVSPGATASFRVQATATAGSMVYQWSRAGVPRSGATNATLVLTNIDVSMAGPYSVAVTDATGTTESRVASLDVDPTFAKVMHDPAVELSASTYGCAFGDFDDDGFPDLYVANAARPRNCLYRNNGDGTFSEIGTGLWAANREPAAGGVWGDYDNDGRLDLLVAATDMHTVALVRNLGGGTFTNLPAAQSGLTNRGDFIAAAWADLEPDGFLDFAAIEYDRWCWLYRSDRKGGFTRLTGTGLTPASKQFHACTWSDYDRDGRLDLFLTVYGEAGFLYRNRGNAQFSQVTNRAPGVATADIVSACWGDYDNDGYPDLFLASGGYVSRQRSFLYHNESGAGFVMVTNGSPGSVAQGVSGSWGDYDNDGFLDLFVCNAVGQDNCLYHNNGDGTFTQILRGSPVHDGAHSVNSIWGDINNDGFLDLYVGNGGSDGQQTNCLYLNNGNGHAWLLLKLVGTVSNRAAIGAKVEVLAAVRGAPLRQSREVSGGTGWCAQNDLRVHFGLGDAAVAELVRIEWPSGIVQELKDVPTRRILTVTEPPRLTAATNACFMVQCWKGMAFDVESSGDLARWTVVGCVTNLTGVLEVPVPEASGTTGRFYRVRQR